MAGGYNQLGYAKYYRVWDTPGTGTIAPTTEGYEVSLIFIPTSAFNPAGVPAVFDIFGYESDPLDLCAPLLTSGAVVQIPAECDDPAGTPPLRPARVTLGGTLLIPAPGATFVSDGVGCEVSFPCMSPFLSVVAVSGQTAQFDVVLRIGRLKRARF